MANIHRTSRGQRIDMDKLMTIHERTIAVGNAGVNARGDVVKGNKIIKSREEVAKENYNIRGNNVVKDVRANEIIPDVGTTTPYEDPYEDLVSQSEPTEIVEQTPLGEVRGGLANAVSKSQELAEKLAAQRKRI